MKRMFTKSKTKADILSMLDRMIAQHGDAMSIPMLRVDQSDQTLHLRSHHRLPTGYDLPPPPQPGKPRGHSARSGHEKGL